MNVNDMEIVRSVLQSSGYVESIENELTNVIATHQLLFILDIWQTDIVLIMTCAIREGAEQKIWKHIESLQSFRHNKQRRCIVGVLGMMI
jgi:tRNA A37 methylthiotransferase MiaB